MPDPGEKRAEGGGQVESVAAPGEEEPRPGGADEGLGRLPAKASFEEIVRLPCGDGGIFPSRGGAEALTLYYGTGFTLSIRTSGVRVTLTIGQVATAADVNIQTIRYYERRGLFPTPRRTPAGYRLYADEAVARLRFIKHAQELGFSLQEIQELLGLRVRHGAACDAVERKTRKKIEVVQQRIRDLQRMKRTLERLAAACTDRQPTDDCPILEVLEDHDDVRH